MNAKTFKKHSEYILDKIQNTMLGKADEYASEEDALSNFIQPTSMLGINRAEVCLSYDMKHIASMVKIAQDANQGKLPSKELLEEKVGDYLGYGLLFYANMLEMMGIEEPDTPKK